MGGQNACMDKNSNEAERSLALPECAVNVSLDEPTTMNHTDLVFRICKRHGLTDNETTLVLLMFRAGKLKECPTGFDYSVDTRPFICQSNNAGFLSQGERNGVVEQFIDVLAESVLSQRETRIVPMVADMVNKPFGYEIIVRECHRRSLSENEAQLVFGFWSLRQEKTSAFVLGSLTVFTVDTTSIPGHDKVFTAHARSNRVAVTDMAGQLARYVVSRRPANVPQKSIGCDTPSNEPMPSITDNPLSLRRMTSIAKMTNAGRIDHLDKYAMWLALALWSRAKFEIRDSLCEGVVSLWPLHDVPIVVKCGSVFLCELELAEAVLHYVQSLCSEVKLPPIKCRADGNLQLTRAQEKMKAMQCNWWETAIASIVMDHAAVRSVVHDGNLQYMIELNFRPIFGRVGLMRVYSPTMVDYASLAQQIVNYIREPAPNKTPIVNNPHNLFVDLRERGLKCAEANLVSILLRSAQLYGGHYDSIWAMQVKLYAFKSDDDTINAVSDSESECREMLINALIDFVTDSRNRGDNVVDEANQSKYSFRDILLKKCRSAQLSGIETALALQIFSMRSERQNGEWTVSVGLPNMTEPECTISVKSSSENYAAHQFIDKLISWIQNMTDAATPKAANSKSDNLKFVTESCADRNFGSVDTALSVMLWQQRTYDNENGAWTCSIDVGKISASAPMIACRYDTIGVAEVELVGAIVDFVAKTDKPPFQCVDEGQTPAEEDSVFDQFCDRAKLDWNERALAVLLWRHRQRHDSSDRIRCSLILDFWPLLHVPVFLCTPSASIGITARELADQLIAKIEEMRSCNDLSDMVAQCPTRTYRQLQYVDLCDNVSVARHCRQHCFTINQTSLIMATWKTRITAIRETDLMFVTGVKFWDVNRFVFFSGKTEKESQVQAFGFVLETVLTNGNRPEFVHFCSACPKSNKHDRLSQQCRQYGLWWHECALAFALFSQRCITGNGLHLDLLPITGQMKHFTITGKHKYNNLIKQLVEFIKYHREDNPPVSRTDNAKA